MSLHIADLEAHIGAPLLVRKRGEVRPSAVGEVLVERARRLLADADEAMDLVQRQVQGLAGRVRQAPSTRAIAPLLPHAQHPLRQPRPRRAQRSRDLQRQHQPRAKRESCARHQP